MVTSERFSISYEKLIEDVQVGSIILLDDGLIELEVTNIDANKGINSTYIENAGTLKNKKGVNVPGVSVQLPGITEKDAARYSYLVLNKKLISSLHHLYVVRKM